MLEYDPGYKAKAISNDNNYLDFLKRNCEQWRKSEKRKKAIAGNKGRKVAKRNSIKMRPITPRDI